MLGMEKRLKVLYGDVSGAEQAGSARAAASDERGSEVGKLGMALAILAILLTTGFYLALDLKISEVRVNVTDRLDPLLQMQGGMKLMETKIAGVEKRVADLEGLPLEAKRMILSAYVQDMAQRADLLGSQVEAAETKAKLAQIKELLGQVQAGMAR